MGLPGLHKSDAIITLPRVSIIIRVFVDQLNTERCQFSLTAAAAAAAAAAAVHIIVERDWRVTLKGEWRRVSGLNIRSVSPATGRRRHHPAVIQLRRTTTAAAGYDHGGYISPFGRHFWNISCSLQATLLPLLSHFLGLLLVCQLLWAARGAPDVVTTCAHARCAA